MSQHFGHDINNNIIFVLPNVCRVIMIMLIICVDAIIGCTIIKIMKDLKYKNSFVDKAV